MPLFTWKKDLDLGIAAMDRDHRELVEAMNAIHALHTAGAPKPALDAAILQLLKLTRQHFAAEEKYMAAVAFLGLAAHAKAHAGLLAKLEAYRARFRKGDGYLPPEFFDFLALWLGAHIQGTDRNYAPQRAPARV